MSTIPLPENARERLRTGGQFADVLQAGVKARGHPFVARVVSWFNLCRVCQDVEEQMLLASAIAPADEQLHRALLSSAIASGEGLLLEGADPRRCARSSSHRKACRPSSNRCASPSTNGTRN